MENKNDGFQYTYSANEQEEIRKIREKYIKKGEDKMERLRRLDASATQKAQVISLIFGVIGVLVLGLGMSMFMTDLGNKIGITGNLSMIFGVIIGIIGGVLTVLAYPAYNFVLKNERKKIAPEIIRLTDELMK